MVAALKCNFLLISNKPIFGQRNNWQPFCFRSTQHEDVKQLLICQRISVITYSYSGEYQTHLKNYNRFVDYTFVDYKCRLQQGMSVLQAKVNLSTYLLFSFCFLFFFFWKLCSIDYLFTHLNLQTLFTSSCQSRKCTSEVKQVKKTFIKASAIEERDQNTVLTLLKQ